MTKVQANPSKKVDEARQWCIAARKLLNLGVLDRKKLDLKDRATAISKNLASLRGKLSDKAFAALESDFLAIAQRIDTQAKAGNRSQVEVEAEFFREGSLRTAYGSIVGGGPNGAVLHFSPTSRPSERGRSSSWTRPPSGRATPPM